jgi:prepilin-type N-terminal cleavage/methylation domain-containing protein
MTRRSGMTLVEVLVAIFIMAIGLLALLTLFPLGALNMAQAIKDQRVAEAGRNAGAIADTTWEYSTAAGAPPPVAPYAWTLRLDPLVQTAMVNPGTPPGFGAALLNLLSPPPPSSGPSYPVLVDPIGLQMFGAPTDPSGRIGWVGTQAPGYSGIPRTTLRILRPIPPTDPLGVDPNMNPANVNYNAYLTKQVYRWTTLLDDITFDENGVPDVSTGNVQHEGRYSWAWLVQAPSAAAAAVPVVNVKVLVFNGRSLDLNSGTLSAQGENSYVANFGQDSSIPPVHNSRVINIQWSASQPKPNLIANSWVLDATMQPTPCAYFYRVLNVTDTGIDPNTGNSQMDVEVQSDVSNHTGQGFVIVFDNLVEVIDRLQQ